MALSAGDRVRVGRNDAKCPAGSTGRFLRVMEETGNLLIDVDGRGPVAFTKDSVMTMDGAAATVAQRRTMSPETRARMSEAQRARHAGRLEQTEDAVTDSPTPEKAPGLTRELYLDGHDTAEELGVKPDALKRMATALRVGSCRSASCRYTAREIAKLRQFQGIMSELGTGPAQTLKLLRLARRLDPTKLAGLQ